MRKIFVSILVSLSIVLASQVYGNVVGFNIAGTDETPKLAGELADGCYNWTDAIDPTGSGLSLDGTDGLVSVAWESANLWHHGPEGSNDEQIYRIYLDDGNPVVVTFDGLGDWVAAHNAEGYVIRIYQNTDWADNTFPSIDITDGSNVLETVQATDIWREDGARAFVDTSVLDAGEIELRLSPRNLDARERSTFAAAKITLIDKYFPIDYSPENDVEVPVTQKLTWQQDAEAAGMGVTYNVYFGEDPNVISPTYYGLEPVKTTSDDPADFNYDPGTLANSIDYYWRVDAIVPDGGSSVVHTGEERWFVTQPASPRIEDGPVSMTVPAGIDTELTVKAINVETYQWYKNGEMMTDAQTDMVSVGDDIVIITLSLDGIQVADEGYYYCIVDNSLQQPATSVTAQVMTERLVGWWKLDGDLTDSVTDEYSAAKVHDGISVDPNFVETGIDGGAVQFYGDIDDIIVFTDSVDDFNFYPLGYTVSAWVKIPETIGSWTAYVSKEGVFEDQSRGGFILTATDSGEAISTLRQSYNDMFTGVDISGGDWHHVVATYNAETFEATVFVDGYQRNQTVNTSTVAGSVGNLILGAQDEDGGSAMVGFVDDVKVWSYPLDVVSIVAMYTDFNPGVEICAFYPEFDVAGPDGIGDEYKDCKVDIYDFVYFSTKWLECNLVPTCKP